MRARRKLALRRRKGVLAPALSSSSSIAVKGISAIVYTCSTYFSTIAVSCVHSLCSICRGYAAAAVGCCKRVLWWCYCCCCCWQSYKMHDDDARCSTVTRCTFKSTYGCHVRASHLRNALRLCAILKTTTTLMPKRVGGWWLLCAMWNVCLSERIFRQHVSKY